MATKSCPSSITTKMEKVVLSLKLLIGNSCDPPGPTVDPLCRVDKASKCIDELSISVLKAAILGGNHWRIVCL